MPEEERANLLEELIVLKRKSSVYCRLRQEQNLVNGVRADCTRLVKFLLPVENDKIVFGF